MVDAAGLAPLFAAVAGKMLLERGLNEWLDPSPVMIAAGQRVAIALHGRPANIAGDLGRIDLDRGVTRANLPAVCAGHNSCDL